MSSQLLAVAVVVLAMVHDSTNIIVLALPAAWYDVSTDRVYI